MHANIETLTTWPVKGMAARTQEDYIEIGHDGLVRDRGYMLVEAAEHITAKGKVLSPGRFLAMRHDPTLVRFTPCLIDGGLSVNHPEAPEPLQVFDATDNAANRIPVNVWDWDGMAVDQGDAAADWHSRIVGRPVRLVAVSQELPRHPENRPELGVMGFGDSYPLTVVTNRSIDLVNKELEKAGHEPISVLRPRSNIVLSEIEIPQVSDLPEGAFPEDFIDEICVSQDGLRLVLKRRKACGRCPVPDTNEITGEVRGAPVRQALGKLARRGFHADPRFSSKPELFWSQNFTVQVLGGVSRNAPFKLMQGAQVEVSYSDVSNWNMSREN